jgi:hypothetical protein
MQATIAKEHPHGRRASQGVSGSVGDVAAGGGKPVVPSAALNQAIADAGFFMQVALAAITPVAILDKKHPK